MDAEAVHQRDVATILTKLQEDLKNVQEKHRKNPTTKEALNEEISKLISNADLDLRLKTQAIVRARLSQSRVLPFSMTKPVAKPKEPQHSHSALSPPLPPLKPPNEQSFQKLIESSVPQPIGPIMKPATRNTTALTPSFFRKELIDSTPPLPKRDIHDPGAPIPEIDQRHITKYGLNRLEESGLVTENLVANELNGLITVSPFVYDFTKSTKKPDDLSGFVLDKNKDNDEIKPQDNGNLDELTPVQPEQKEITSTGRQKHARLQFINGEVFTASQDYREFKHDNSNVWEEIEVIFQLLKRACFTYGFSKVQVDAHAVLDLLQYEPDEISEDRLLLCFVDIPAGKDRKNHTKVGVGFVGPNAENKAATVIQSVWRGFFARREVRMIRRTAAAVRILQRWWRNMRTLKSFRTQVRKERERRILTYNQMHHDASRYNVTEPRVVVHLIDGHLPIEFGRFIDIRDRGVVLVLFTRRALPMATVYELQEQCPDKNQLHIIYAQQKLPDFLPIEDVLASDSRSMSKIKSIAGTLPVYIHPHSSPQSVFELSFKLNAIILSPPPIKTSLLTSQEAVRRLFEAAGTSLFYASDVIFDRFVFCQTVANLCISNLDVMMWMVKINDGSVGWISTDEIALLEKMRTNREMLSEEDMNDPHFKELCAQNISNDLDRIVNAVGERDPFDFLNAIWSKGAVIEEAPLAVRSAPAATIFMPPCGNLPVITATWERLYISAFEEFARIYPAFMIKGIDFKPDLDRMAVELAQREITGYTTVNYYYSANSVGKNDEDKYQIKLNAESVDICSEEPVLSQWLAEMESQNEFNQSELNYNGNYTYVQQSLKIPKPMKLSDILDKLGEANLPVDKKIFIVPDLTDSLTIGLVICSDSPLNLINLVYSTLCALCTNVFDIASDPSNILFTYCQAIEFLKMQLSTQKVLTSTVLMKKIKKINVSKLGEMSKDANIIVASAGEGVSTESLETLESDDESKDNLDGTDDANDTTNESNENKTPEASGSNEQTQEQEQNVTAEEEQKPNENETNDETTKQNEENTSEEAQKQNEEEKSEQKKEEQSKENAQAEKIVKEDKGISTDEEKKEENK